MKLIIGSVWLVLVFPLVTPGRWIANSTAPANGSDITRPQPDQLSPAAATAGGWRDLYSVSQASTYNPEDLYSGDSDSAGTDSLPRNRNRSDKVTGVTAIVLVIWALRLYFKSPGFQRFLFEEFSPLSPLGY